jgi:Family of unknown function (DUF6356)
MAAPQFLDTLLFQHPRAVGESYGQHFAVAWSFGSRMLVGALAALVHAVLPGLCVTTASRIARELHAQLEQNKRGEPIRS